MNYKKDVSRMKNNIEGDIGEISATQFLENNGYKILHTKYKTKFGEIDIIALKDGVIVFVEVKRRSTLAYGRPIEAIDYRKQQKIRRVAEFYLMINRKYYSDCRFDVIEILDKQINHLVNAF